MTESLPADLVTRTWSRPFEGPDAIPESVEVVIIGGGIIGVSTAWFLARQGKVSPCARRATSRVRTIGPQLRLGATAACRA